MRQVRKVHAASGKTYGARRITAELRAGGLEVNRNRSERLMRQHAIRGRGLKRRHRTTIPDPADQAVPDLLRRNFTASGPDRAWTGARPARLANRTSRPSHGLPPARLPQPPARTLHDRPPRPGRLRREINYAGPRCMTTGASTIKAAAPSANSCGS
ncbi:IS3 family transposase [Streptomyces sp. NPDC006691]|uniref:IS3 family transposase n=1 Tax=Streptomyces sp. NPDC006691 TaxID=3364757 RepID=UPI0036736720